MNLAAMMQQQQAWIMAGQEGILTDKGKMYNTASDWIKTSQITDNPEEYLTDPESQEAQQVAAAMAEQQQQQAAAMQQQQDSIQQMSFAIEQMKLSNDKT